FSAVKPKREGDGGAQRAGTWQEEGGRIGQAHPWQGIPGCTQSQGACNNIANDGRGAHLGYLGECWVEGGQESCLLLCLLGYVQMCIGDFQVWEMIDSSLMVNLLPTKLVCNTDLVHWQANIGMQGIGGHKCKVESVVEG
ncbi:hypothetical protein VP01_11380g1, partial [Puccinia sorghi]